MARLRTLWQVLLDDDRGAMALLVLATAVLVLPFGSLLLLLRWPRVRGLARALRIAWAA